MAELFDEVTAHLITLLPDKGEQHHITAYKPFILYTLSSLHTYTYQRKQQILSFLLQHPISECYRITKYDEKHREYYNIMIAIYGISCPHFNADYSIDINAPILINMLTQMINRCTCTKTNLLHLQLMHS